MPNSVNLAGVQITRGQFNDLMTDLAGAAAAAGGIMSICRAALNGKPEEALLGVVAGTMGAALLTNKAKGQIWNLLERLDAHI